MPKRTKTCRLYVVSEYNGQVLHLRNMFFILTNINLFHQDILRSYNQFFVAGKEIFEV